MSKPIVLPNTFSIDDIQLVYSSTRNPVFRQNLAVIRSVMKGFSTADICDIFMISETTFFNIVAKYREGGIDAVDDQRKSNGANPKFDQEELEDAKKNCLHEPILMAAFGLPVK
jgi:transposase